MNKTDLTALALKYIAASGLVGSVFVLAWNETVDAQVYVALVSAALGGLGVHVGMQAGIASQGPEAASPENASIVTTTDKSTTTTAKTPPDLPHEEPKP